MMSDLRREASVSDAFDKVRREKELSTTKKAGKVAVGMFLVLSVVVFGSILFVGFCCVNTDTIVADAGAEGEYLEALDDPDLDLKQRPIEAVPEYDKGIGIDRGYMELVPE